jgi:hypothetical protein
MTLSNLSELGCPSRTVMFEPSDKIPSNLLIYFFNSEDFGVGPFSENLVEKINGTIEN